MIRFTTCKLGLAVAFATLAVGANAQPVTSAQGKTGTTAAASANDTAKAPSATKKSTTARSATTKSHMANRGMATHRAAASHRNRSNAMEANGGDSAYRAALRACVKGPESQRDSCLDDAISRYAHA
ncbi:MAG TPA: hypothetical protein VGL90_09630 [Casimicrobiaceae bacterium]|jgi:hypothetical protein|nr:hypothetical protein [Casimicrobiaceae bacterium]